MRRIEREWFTGPGGTALGTAERWTSGERAAPELSRTAAAPAALGASAHARRLRADAGRARTCPRARYGRASGAASTAGGSRVSRSRRAGGGRAPRHRRSRSTRARSIRTRFGARAGRARVRDDGPRYHAARQPARISTPVSPRPAQASHRNTGGGTASMRAVAGAGPRSTRFSRAAAAAAAGSASAPSNSAANTARAGDARYRRTRPGPRRCGITRTTADASGPSDTRQRRVPVGRTCSSAQLTCVARSHATTYRRTGARWSMTAQSPSRRARIANGADLGSRRDTSEEERAGSGIGPRGLMPAVGCDAGWPEACMWSERRAAA